jgi:hypothetical protein
MIGGGVEVGVNGVVGHGGGDVDVDGDVDMDRDANDDHDQGAFDEFLNGEDA